MGFAFENAWLIPALPFVSFLIVALFISPRSEKVAGIVATLSVFTSALLAMKLGWEYFGAHPAGAEHPSLIAWSVEWLRYQDSLSVTAGVLVDSASVLLMIVVTTVSSLVHLYSIGYMKGEKGYGRYFAYLNLFTFSMLGLVVSPNILQMFVFWELVGVSSFLLIGFYYWKPSAVSASKKAFIVTRFADLFFLIGVLLLGYHGYQMVDTFAVGALAGAQPFDFSFLNSPAVAEALAADGTLTTAMILIFIGAAGKSAMFPLHIWLPDAMEGPTPVSALIHAATMVVAGVYLVARLFPAFTGAPDALMIVAYIGAFTSLFAAVIACTQNDIKRVLAFSTLSQLGYMMFALGVASWDNALGYTAALFHLFTHAFFKALLFLGAGSVIHAAHSNDIWDMGGLRKKMPITHITFLIATLAIAGVPPLAGFFSKDEILAAAFSNHHTAIYGIGMLVAGITAFYMFRIYFITFWGKPRTENAGHAHEAPVTMTLPLIILAALSIVAGFVPFGDYVSSGAGSAGHASAWAIAIPAVSVGLIGIFISWLFYGSENNRAQGLVDSLGSIHRAIYNKFYIDEVYLFVTKKIIFPYVARPVAWFDKKVVDGAVDLTGWLTKQSGFGLAKTQTGQAQTYGFWLVNGAIAVTVLLWVWLG